VIHTDTGSSLPIQLGVWRQEKLNGIEALHIASRPPYPEQETEELGDDIVARLNPWTGRVESLEVLFFSERLQSNELFELPVTADLQRSGEAERSP
jgi:hypothetical protein